MDNDFNKVFAENLKQYLARDKMTQAQLAKLLGVSAASVTGWIKGEQAPRMDKLDKMCEIFGCSRSALMEPKAVRDSRTEALLNSLHKEAGILLAAADGLKPEDVILLAQIAQRMKDNY